MIKYIGYCRKSTDEKNKQVLSIDQQIAELKEFALKQNLEIIDYVCESRTAKTTGRPLFNKMLERIENGEAQGIVSWHADRLARNSIDGGKVIYSLDTGKLIDLKFPSFWFENSPQGKFVLNLAFGQSKYYVDNLSENVKRGMKHKVRLGIWPVQAPLGYLNDKLNKNIVVDVIRSKAVKKCFEMFATGKHSFTSISDYLFGLNIKSRSDKKIKVDTIKRILSNRFYLGILVYKGELHKGIHKPIISKQLFEATQKQIVRFERPRYNGHDFPFIGLARCGECGGAITAESHSRKYKNGNCPTFIYYRCTKKFGVCKQKYVSEVNLAKQLRKSVHNIIIPSEWKEKWLELLEQDKQKELVKAEENTALTETELQTTEIKLSKLLDTYLDGVVNEEDYKKKKNELFNKKLKLEEEIIQIKSRGSSWLEPLEHFIMSAFQAQKIAQEKNEYQNLSDFVRSACSNFFLTDQ
ncbi:MAG: recombinase family protein, partial [Patescibacteria group bacterium]